MEQIMFGARLKYWSYLFVAVFLLLLSKLTYAQTISNGLNYTTYLPTSGGWTSPNRDLLTPLTSGTVLNLDYNWNYVLDSGRNDGVVVKFTGYFKADAAGTYTFGITGDDGIELIIKNQTVISYWADQGPTLRSGSITLAAGEVVPVTIWFYENGGGATLRWYQQINGSWVIVPTTSLATSEAYWGPQTISTANSNMGFETSTLQNWTANRTGTQNSSNWGSSGVGASVVTGITNFTPGDNKTWTVTPYGTYMASLQPGPGDVSFDQMTIDLGLTSGEVTEIKNVIAAQAAAAGGDPNPTDATWLRRTVSLKSGVTYTIAWQYISTDYVPFNDGSIMVLRHATDATKIPTLNNEQKRYALLGFTNPNTGNYSVGSYGATGWQVAVFTVPVDGDYIIGFSSFNLGDTALSPILLIDEIQGTTLLNGQPFAPVPPNPGSSSPSAGPVLCCGGSANQFTANSAFSNRVTGFIANNNVDNRVIIQQIGNNNTITVTQSGRKNYSEIEITGSNNSVTTNQTSNSNTLANYSELYISGSGNTVSLTQSSTGGNKGIYVTAADSTNNITINQSGSGNHYSELNLLGGNKTVNINQSGSVGHMAKVELNGGSTSINVTQSGSTQQFYSITHNCAQISCSAITVTQGQ
jgi:hypothetical protein